MLDADGSTDAAEIPRFVAALRTGADFVKGSRFAQGGASSDITPLRRAGNLGLNALVNRLYGTSYTDLCYGYNAFWARCLPYMHVDCAGFEVETLINIRIARAGLTIHEVPSREQERLHGDSNLHPVRDGMRILRTIATERIHGGAAGMRIALVSSGPDSAHEVAALARSLARDGTPVDVLGPGARGHGEPYDVVHAHGSRALTALLTLGWHSAGRVATADAHAALWPRRRMLEAADRIICRSRAEAARLGRHAPSLTRRIRLVPGRRRHRGRAPDRRATTPGRDVVLCVDRLDRDARLDRAVAALPALGDEVELAIVGAGPARARAGAPRRGARRARARALRRRGLRRRAAPLAGHRGRARSRSAAGPRPRRCCSARWPRARRSSPPTCPPTATRSSRCTAAARRCSSPTRRR